MSSSRSRSRSRGRSRSYSRSRSRSFSRSRSPYTINEESDQECNDFDKNSQKSGSTKSSIGYKFMLKVTNAPLDWNWETFRDYIKENSNDPILKSEHIFIYKKRDTLNLRFSKLAPYEICYKYLSGLEIEGRKLKVETVAGKPRSSYPSSYDIADADCDIANFHYTQLLIKNGPNWSWDRLRNYFVQESQSPVMKTQPPHIQKLEHGKFVLKFQTAIVCKMYYKELSEFKIDGKKLVVEILKDGTNDIAKQPRKRRIQTSSNTRYSQNSKETYGLTIPFLNSLDIKPPLVNRVYIGNLTSKTTKEKLLEVFSFAGQVINVVMFPTADDGLSAKVEFDHPVEAVQAVSMFNKQTLFGKQMTVKIDQKPFLNNLPVGLNAIGPGLGPNGIPLRGIRNSVEIEPLKQLMVKELAELKSLKTMEMNKSTVPNSGVGLLGNPFQPMVPPVNIEPVNPFAAAPFYGMGFANQTPTWQGLLPPTATANDYQSASFNTTMFNNMRAMAGSNQSQSQSQSQPSEPKQPKYDYNSSLARYTDKQPTEKQEPKSPMTSDLLIFTNLPQSVTMQALKNKMTEIGEVVFAEITTQGRAIVRFKNTEDAQRCIGLYDRSRVDGQQIAVNCI